MLRIGRIANRLWLVALVALMAGATGCSDATEENHEEEASFAVTEEEQLARIGDLRSLSDDPKFSEVLDVMETRLRSGESVNTVAADLDALEAMQSMEQELGDDLDEMMTDDLDQIDTP